MWIKLLSTESMGTLLKPQFVNGRWRKPAIQARQKKELQNYFKKAGVPWIYDKERPEVHESSAYNKRPKGTAFMNNYETRLATVRKNLSGMDERITKLRKDRLDNKPRSNDEQHMLGVYKALSAEQTASKYKQSASKARAAKAAANRDIGIETRKSSPVKKGGAGSSRGGALSKRERETNAIGNDLMSTGVRKTTQSE